MKHSALLIDLENFVLGREKSAGAADAAQDAADLLRFARDLAAPRRLAVRRAYANFNVRREVEGGDKPFEYYLQAWPRLLMDLGVEPVHSFAFPGGGSKNACDMKMAMDAAALTASGQVDQVVFVTGDADFIPVMLDLRQRGVECAAIGIRGATKAVFERYADRFHFFEDMQAAEAIEGAFADPEALALVRETLRKALIRRPAALPLEAVAFMLARRVPSGTFRGASARDFLERFESELGVRIHGEPGTPQSVTLAGLAPVMLQGAEPVPARTFRPQVVVPAPAAGEAPARPAAEIHHPDHYAFLLRREQPKYYRVPLADFDLITQAVWDTAVAPDGTRRVVRHADLTGVCAERAAAAGLIDAPQRVQSVLFQCYKGGSFICRSGGVHDGSRDFHWSLPAALVPEIADVETLRRRLRAQLVQVLAERLVQFDDARTIQPEALAELLFGAPSEPGKLAKAKVLMEGVKWPALPVAAVTTAPAAPASPAAPPATA